MNDNDKVRLKEVREWGTFMLSLLTVVAIPIGLVVLRNQRLEIEREVTDKFLTRSEYVDDKNLTRTGYNEDKSRYEEERRNILQTIGVVQGKLDSVLFEQVRLNDSFSLIKEKFNQATTTPK